MTFIDAESSRSRVTCMMVVAEWDWMRIQNLPNRIGCGVKKAESAHLCCVCAANLRMVWFVWFDAILYVFKRLLLLCLLIKWQANNAKVIGYYVLYCLT